MRHDGQRTLRHFQGFLQSRTDLDIRHIRIRPCTSITNGKAARFIQTAIREWAYAAAYQTSTQRRD